MQEFKVYFWECRQEKYGCALKRCPFWIRDEIYDKIPGKIYEYPEKMVNILCNTNHAVDPTGKSWKNSAEIDKRFFDFF